MDETLQTWILGLAPTALIGIFSLIRWYGNRWNAALESERKARVEAEADVEESERELRSAKEENGNLKVERMFLQRDVERLTDQLTEVKEQLNRERAGNRRERRERSTDGDDTNGGPSEASA